MLYRSVGLSLRLSRCVPIAASRASRAAGLDASHASAQTGFARAHGPGLERLRAVRKGFVPERALYVRLALLQAVVAHHLGYFADARMYIASAESQLNALKVRAAAPRYGVE